MLWTRKGEKSYAQVYVTTDVQKSYGLRTNSKDKIQEQEKMIAFYLVLLFLTGTGILAYILTANDGEKL